MGRVMNRIKLTNLDDRIAVDLGVLPPGQVRSIEVEALVDTGATMLTLPAWIAARLGLRTIQMTPLRYADGRREEVPEVMLEIELVGRTMHCNALVVTPGAVPLIGQLQLEQLDLIVDPRSQEVRVNPAHPDGPLAEA